MCGISILEHLPVFAFVNWNRSSIHCTNNIPFSGTANLIMFGLGNIIGWCAPALSILISENTPLITGPLTIEQMSWIGSFNAIGSLIGSLVFGYIISLIGCKQTTLSLAIPSITFWLLIYFGNTYYHILMARFCGGLIMGGAMSTIMLYTSEIANDKYD